MSGFFSRLVRQSGVYALGNVALKLSGLVLIPLYLNLLSTATYGHFALLDTTARLAILLGGLGLATGLLRFMTNAAYEEAHAALPFTALVTTGGAAVAVGALLWGLAAPLAALLVDDASQAGLVRLMAVYAACKVVEAIPTMLLRTQERPGLYVTATLAEMLVLIGCVFLFLVRLDRGLQGVMEAYAVSAGVGAVVLCGGMLATVKWEFRADLVRPLARFGAPLVVAGLASLFLNLGDRYLLKILVDAEGVGVYDWAGRLGGVINMFFVQSFQLAFGVLGLKALGEEPDGARLYRRVFRHYAAWSGWGVLGLSLLALDFTYLVSDNPAYLSAEVLVLPIALGFMAYGIYYVVVNVLYASGRTRVLPPMVFGAALLNAVLNLLLIPALGLLGAAFATLAAYAFLTALAARVAERQIRVGYAWGKLAQVVGLVVGLFLLGRLSVEWATIPRLALRLVLILAYLPALLLLRIYRIEEVKEFAARLAARR